MLFNPHCLQNTDGAKIHSNLIIRPNDLIVHKGISSEVDSYSCFFDVIQSNKTEAHELLQKARTKTLYFVGVATDYCVKFSVLDALKLGYKVYVIEDGIHAVCESDGKKAIEEMKSKGAIFLHSSKIAFQQSKLEQSSFQPTKNDRSAFRQPLVPAQHQGILFPNQQIPTILSTQGHLNSVANTPKIEAHVITTSLINFLEIKREKREINIVLNNDNRSFTVDIESIENFYIRDHQLSEIHETLQMLILKVSGDYCFTTGKQELILKPKRPIQEGVYAISIRNHIKLRNKSDFS
jgi:hypothetical protein